MSALIISSWNGTVHTAIDHSDEHRRRRESLGTELRRIPLTPDEAKWPIGSLLLILAHRGKLK